MRDRPRWFVAGIGVGVAIALTAVGLYRWYAYARPSWDAVSLSVVGSEAVPRFLLDDATNEFATSGFRLAFSVRNNRGTDIQLARDVRIMRRKQPTGSLEPYRDVARLDEPLFVPRGDVAELSLFLDVSCRNIDEKGTSTQRDSGVCYSDNTRDTKGFVLFDEAERLQVELPTPMLRAPRDP